jgi:hypothetical protein
MFPRGPPLKQLILKHISHNGAISIRRCVIGPTTEVAVLKMKGPTRQGAGAVTWHLADAFQEHEFRYNRTMMR